MSRLETIMQGVKIGMGITGLLFMVRVLHLLSVIAAK